MHEQIAGYFVMRLTGRGCGTADAIKKALLNKLEASAPGQPEPEAFSDVKDIEVVAYKTDIIGNSGFLFHPSWNTPGVSKGMNG